jgi:glucose/arabinose dehydrogenase
MDVFAMESDPNGFDTGPHPILVAPHKQLIPKVRIADAIGWPDQGRPRATNGFQVSAFAGNLDHPRWLYVLPNGDVLVAETNAPDRPEDRRGLRGWIMKKEMAHAGAGTPSANRITLLRDADHDGNAEVHTEFLTDLCSPFGMALIGQDLYVANTDGIMKYRYSPGDTKIKGAGEQIVPLPAGEINHHWTKNILASPDGTKLYATVGSNSNVGENGLENEQSRAAILEIDLQKRSARVFASGIRNANGLDWQPKTRELWAAVNERDEIGDRLVPDYISSVKEGAFYGWPYSYYGQHVDARVKEQDAALARKAIAPDYALGSHVAALGFTFYRADATAPALFPERYRNGAFVGEHGSWNRSDFSGYRVVFVPFDASGRPVGPIENFLTGFIDDNGKAMGRPVGVAVDKSGALLVADDVGNRVWRVEPQKRLLATNH